MPNWIDLVVKLTPAFVAFVVGIVGSGIGYLQYRTNRDKLRLDLFSKRHEAYEKLLAFFTEVLREGTVEREALPLLAEARNRSRFMFGPEIEARLEIVWEKAVRMKSLNTRLFDQTHVLPQTERDKASDEHESLMQWMLDEIENMPKLYSRYLHFR